MGIEDGFAKKNSESGSGHNRHASARASRAAERRNAALREAQKEEALSAGEDEDWLDDDLSDGFLDEDFDEDDFAEEDDLFDDVLIGDENTQDDASIAEDTGMEEKLLGQAMGNASASGTSAGSKAGTGRRVPRELNTAKSAIDQKKLHRENEEKKKSLLKKAIIWAAVELFTLCLIFAYAYVVRNLSRMGHTEVNKAVVENDNLTMEKKKEMEGYWNFYVFGLDTRDGRVSRGNSDVIMICSINQDTGDIKIVSVFRDTYLNISSKDSYNKINQAYAQGGPEQAIAALNKNLDLNITNYVTINWSAVAHGINILGGIDDVDISSAELYYINAFITETVNSTGIGSVQLTSTGPQHLDGVQAVAYGRLRLMDNDFARTERQREVIEKAFAKAKQSDFAVLNNILVDCFPMVSIDIEFNDLARMAQSISKYNIAGTGGFPWQRGDANIPGKGACVIPATLESNVTQLHEFLFGDVDYQPSDAVVGYSQRIKEDSNIYKEGRVIESVGTDNGVIQKPKTTAAASETASTVKETTERQSRMRETDENGDYLYETDEDGNEIRETDEDGNPIETRPTSLLEDETDNDEGSELVDDEGNVIATRPQHTVNPTAGLENRTDPSGNTISQSAHSVNPTGTQAETTAAQVNPTGTTAARPTEVIPDEPQTVSPITTVGSTEAGPSSGGSNGPTSASVSPEGPHAITDTGGPGAAITDTGAGTETALSPGSVTGPGA